MQGTPELIKLLGQIDPYLPYGLELFNALAPLGVNPAIEAVCIRMHQPQNSRPAVIPELDVYLTKRSKNETAYPGQWHVPGSIMRPGETYEVVFDRLSKKEFGGTISSWKFVTIVNNTHEERGHFLSLVHLCHLKERKNSKGRWFPVSRIPKNTLLCHRRKIIRAAIGAFLVNSVW